MFVVIKKCSDTNFHQEYKSSIACSISTISSGCDSLRDLASKCEEFPAPVIIILEVSFRPEIK